MSIHDILRSVQPVIEGYMLDTIKIYSLGGEPQVDPVTLATTHTEIVHYQGKAMVNAMGTPTLTMVGAVPVSRTTYEIQIPLGLDLIPSECEAKVLESFDPTLLGTPPLKITGPVASSFVVARRLSAHLDRPVQ